MTPEERRRNLAKARKVRAQKVGRERRELATEHRRYKRIWQTAIARHHRALTSHGEDSPQAQRAYRKMVAAEIDWFRTFPREAA